MPAQRLLRKYRSEGFPGLVRAASSRLRTYAKYQEKLQPSFEERWRLVSWAIPSGSGSILDIGSNLGAFTARAAQEGYFSVGIEKDAELVSSARARHSDVAGCAFIQADIDLAMCAKLPQFDAILLLSVHHHWHHNFGARKAAEMLQCIVSKANAVVVFEGPSRSSRYETDIPDFADNCEDALLEYYDRYLEETVGPLASSISRIGKTPCVGEREPFRWMYSIVR